MRSLWKDDRPVIKNAAHTHVLEKPPATNPHHLSIHPTGLLQADPTDLWHLPLPTHRPSAILLVPNGRQRKSQVILFLQEHVGRLLIFVL